MRKCLKVGDRVRHADGFLGTILKVIPGRNKNKDRAYAIRKDGRPDSYFVVQHYNVKRA